MIEGRRSLRLPLEPRQGLSVFDDVIGQKLQGHKSVEGYVLGLVDNTHSATAELLDDPVVRDGLADHPKECYGGRRGKSMKAEKFAASQNGNWRNIAIPLIDPGRRLPPRLIPGSFE
jgi:hypothetical protein